MTTPAAPSTTSTSGADPTVRGPRLSWRGLLRLPFARTRIVAVIVLTAATLMFASAILPGLTVDGWGAALLAAVVIGLLNALVWPLLARFALAVMALTLGLGSLLLNAAVLLLAANQLPGIEVDDFGTALLVTLMLTVVATVVSWAFSLDDDPVWYRSVVARQARRALKSGGRTIPTLDDGSAVPGVLYLQIDGLGYDVFRRALRSGEMPGMASWIAGGSHRVMPWHTDASSQTSASQCAILQGTNTDIPAFRWYEKGDGTSPGRVMVSNHPKDAAEIERRHSTGRGLLHADGVGRNNIFSGDAEQVIMTMSQAGKKQGRLGNGYYAYFANPSNASRTLVSSIVEIGREWRAARLQVRRDVRPRVHRGGVYPLLRAFTTVVSRDIVVSTVIGDMMEGRSVVYADFLGYDEVSHHSGIERYDALEVLRGIDAQLVRIRRAVEWAPRPYHVVVLSDHGQSQGPAFEERFGSPLEDVVRGACGLPLLGASPDVAGAESWGNVGEALTDVGTGEGAVASALRRVSRSKVHDGEVLLGPERSGTVAAEETAAANAPVVLGSGNVGLISFPEWPGRATVEQLAQQYPQLLPALVEHPGIGAVLVRSQERGALALGRDGVHHLDTGEVKGVDPLLPYGPLAAQRLQRTDTFSTCPDLFVISRYDEAAGEVYAFEHLVGSHGGMGGEQSTGFVLHPVDLPEPDGDIVGAAALHEVLTGWLAFVGQPAWVALGAQRQEAASGAA